MCGIFFMYGKDGNIEMSDVIKAAGTVQKRGPETTSFMFGRNTFYCFHRLAINNVSKECNQPYRYKDNDTTYTIMCNGEIYNWKELCKKYDLTDLYNKNNDCGIIYPLLKKLEYNFTELFKNLDGEFAIVITAEDETGLTNIWFGTDSCSVRPLFYTYDDKNDYLLISSLLSGISSLDKITSMIHRVDGGQLYNFQQKQKSKKFLLNKSYYTELFSFQKDFYIDLNFSKVSAENYYPVIIKTLSDAIVKRIDTNNTNRPIGCLLSGGLDSSLVAAISAKYLSQKGEKLMTFSIGMKGSPDLYYARKVADFIGSNHTEVYFTEKEGIDVIRDIIKTTETYDITTIRASVGQYLLAKYISENTNIKVILNGDGADECQMGYLYFYNAPDEIEAQMESLKLVSQIHYFDGLRVDRNISAFGLEARVPYLDEDFVHLFLNVIPSFYKMPKTFGCEKYLIRKAFESQNLLPQDVLWRQKEAFSDGVSSQTKSWYEVLQDHFNNMNIPSKLYCEINSPYTKESCYYRTVFQEIFKERNANVIPRFWLPNWSNESDPSARKLVNIYNKSDK